MMVGHFQRFEERPVFLDKAVHARPLQADGIDEPACNLDRARRGIAADRVKPDAFDDHCAELVQVEELRVFDAVAERARRDHHRVLQLQFADLDGEIHRPMIRRIAETSLEAVGPFELFEIFNSIMPPPMQPAAHQTPALRCRCAGIPSRRWP